MYLYYYITILLYIYILYIFYYIYLSVFLFFFLVFFVSFFSLLYFYYLFKPSNYIFTIINAIMFINITVTGALEESKGGEFQAKNSSDMVDPYLSR